VLIVDQLDAVSTVSGRTSGAFDLVEQLIHEARGTEPATIGVVVVCREFDWQNDSRLRQLLPDSHAQVDVTQFTNDEVKRILNDADFQAEAFRDRQLKILALPQNLSIFLEADFDPSATPTFVTATDIFDRYWDFKRRAVEERFPDTGGHWTAVMNALCDEMTAGQQLSVARERLDGFPAGFLDQLASEGVLTFDGRRYGFGHESFLDYVFARRFVIGTEPLTEFLKGSEQHLFRRAQVRQVLAYLRDRDHARYARELCGPFADDAIRPHLKDLAFALLADVPNPTDEEWAILEDLDRPSAGGGRNRQRQFRRALGACLAAVLRVTAVVRGHRSAWDCRGLAGFRPRGHCRYGGELSVGAPPSFIGARRPASGAVRRTGRQLGPTTTDSHGTGRAPRESALLRPLPAAPGQRRA
jgi:hypothetical protein